MQLMANSVNDNSYQYKYLTMCLDNFNYFITIFLFSIKGQGYLWVKTAEQQ